MDEIRNTMDISLDYVKEGNDTSRKRWVSVESEIEFLSDLLYDGLYVDNYRTYMKIESRIKKLKGDQQYEIS